MSFATHPSIAPSQRPPSSLRTHSSATSTSASSSTSSISSASSTTHSSPQSAPINPSSSKSTSAIHHQPPRRTAATASPLLMLLHPHPPIHTPIPPSLRDRRPSAPNVLPFTAPLALASDQPWYDTAEFQTPAGTPASAPCSTCSSPLADPRPPLPLRKSADSATFPFHSRPH
jgi:hypothetical protein